MPGLRRAFCSCSDVQSAEDGKALGPVIRQSSVLSDPPEPEENANEVLIREFRESVEKSLKKLNSEISQMRNDGREHVSGLVEKLHRDLQLEVFDKQEREARKLRETVVEQHEKAVQIAKDENARLSKSLEQILEGQQKNAQMYTWRPPVQPAPIQYPDAATAPTSSTSGVGDDFALTALLSIATDEGIKKRQSHFVQKNQPIPEEPQERTGRRGSIVAAASRASQIVVKAVKKKGKKAKKQRQQADAEPPEAEEEEYPPRSGENSPVQPLSEPEEEAGDEETDRKKKKKKKRKQVMKEGTKNWDEVIEEEKKKSRASFKAYVEGSTRLRIQERAAETVSKWPLPACLKNWLTHTDDNFMTKITHGRMFALFVNLLIWANVIFIALQAQHRVDQARVGLDESGFFWKLDLAFSGSFALELGMRIFAERITFFLTMDARWNIMDCCFVSLDATNIVFNSIFSVKNSGLDYFAGIRGALRALRLARAGRALRVFRAMKFINMIRLLIDVVQASLIFSLYVLVLFLVMLVFFSVIFMQATVDSYLNQGDVEDIDSLFGSVPQSMLTLFWCMVARGPDEVYDRLDAVSPMYASCLLAFIFFVLFAFMNSVTASFVESAISASRKYDLEGKTSEQLEIEHLLHEADTGNDGKVSLDELREHLNKPNVRDSLTKLGLDAPETRGICELMTPKTGEEVNINELAQVCVRFTRAVRSADFVQVLLANKRLLEDIAGLKAMFFAQFQQPPGV